MKTDRAAPLPTPHSPLPTAPAVLAFATGAELAAFVHRELCAADALDPAQTPLFRTPLTRGGRTCGVIFHVEGPRLLRTSAVWSADDDRILFYDSTGTRAREVKLSEAPPLERAA